MDSELLSDNNDNITTPKSPNSKLKQMSVDTATTDGSNHQNDPLLTQNTVPLKGESDIEKDSAEITA